MGALATDTLPCVPLRASLCRLVRQMRGQDGPVVDTVVMVNGYTYLVNFEVNRLHATLGS